MLSGFELYPRWVPLFLIVVVTEDKYTILVRTTSRYFKFALTYIFSFPFAIWNSNSSSVEMSKQTNRSDLNAKSTAELQERGELEGFQIRKCLIVVEIPASDGSE